MFLRATVALRLLNIRGAARKSTEVAVKDTKISRPYTPELSALPPAPHLRSLQFKGAKRGTIVPILNHEPIPPGAHVDPTHPVLQDQSFRPPTAGNDYFDVKVYPNAMLKRLGVVLLRGGKVRPRPPKELDFPIMQNHKRVKFASVFIMARKLTHKSDVARTRLRRRVTEAIRLVVTRGANADPEGKKVIFVEPEAGEAKWLLRDWYYVIHPKTTAYHAAWPDLIRATRASLSTIVRKGIEWSSSWKIQMAQREATALGRLARREMRRIRMWRRQEQEALARGHIAEDVGIRWKKKGMGIKKRQVEETQKPGVRRGALKALRAPSRASFKNGHISERVLDKTAVAQPVKPKKSKLPQRNVQSDNQKSAELSSKTSNHGRSKPTRAETTKPANKAKGSVSSSSQLRPNLRSKSQSKATSQAMQRTK